jgi:quercetin dioxygenase-like cupin family protein
MHEIKKIIKSTDAIKKQFLGVDFEVLAIGAKSMTTKMLYKKTDFVPFHKHPNEQSEYIISGRYKLSFENQEYILTVGDTYSIPENIEHSLEVIEQGEIIDVFPPVRKDYL